MSASGSLETKTLANSSSTSNIGSQKWGTARIATLCGTVAVAEK